MLLNRPRATAVMREMELDALIATSPENVAYVSDGEFEGARSNPNVKLFAIAPRETSVPLGLVLPANEVDAWAEQPGPIDDLVVYGTLYRNLGDRPLSDDDRRIKALTIEKPPFRSAVEALVEALRVRGLADSPLGLDETNLPGPMWQRVVDALPKARIVPAANLFQRVRMVKTPEEIRRLRQSARITQDAMSATFASVRPGITERELANIYKSEVARHGGTPAFWMLCAGARTGHTHTRQSGYGVQPGDPVKLDMGSIYEFYWSDVARTKVFKGPGRRETEVYGALCDGLRAATAKVRPGVRASELFDVAVNTVRERGIPTFKRHMVGHGIGIVVYDPPLIQSATTATNMFNLPSSDIPLERGMVINIETIYYELGRFGFIVEDTMIVHDDGPELLTDLDYRLELDA
jgi:Xaa-Pro aminopeptidase